MIEHEPVLRDRVIEILKTCGSWTENPEAKIVDCTLGLGGYSEGFLGSFPRAPVFGLDRDGAALKVAGPRLAEWGDRVRVLHANFGDLQEALSAYQPFGAFVFDLGVSNMQLTEGQRGFSFQEDGPLDMRMDPDGSAPTAAEILHESTAEELARIFWTYGEERYARMIATGIKDRLQRGASLGSTAECVAMIRDLLPAPVQRKMGTHPARRVFQALRIYVNDELGELERGLASTVKLAAPGALALVVSYHSLEDRIVKHTFRRWEKEESRGRVLTRHPLLPEPEEVDRNYKARSAKLRAFRFASEADLTGGQGNGWKKKKTLLQ